MGSTATKAAADDQRACHKEAGDVAIAACSRAISSGQYKADELASLYHSRGIALWHKGQWTGVVDDFTQVLRIRPADANALTNRCVGRAALGQLDAALADCNKSIQLSPAQSGRHSSRGLTYLKMGQLDKALADYNEAVRLNPRNSHALYGRGLVKLKKGDAAAGKADITAAKVIQTDIAERFAQFGVK
jgi:tetratricopeptide (TPR) repeat protein